MKIVILAGGLGTRISEETEDKPKPMVLLDDKPILWHLMNIFSCQGFYDFVLTLGYKGNVIKRWLRDLHELQGDFSIETATGKISSSSTELIPNWKVDAVETGLETQTGGRVKKILQKYDDSEFLVTYGDGLANIDVEKLIAFHRRHGKFATVTAVRPPARFGYIRADGIRVTNFGEKIQADEGWVNGGFFLLDRKVADYVLSDDEPFESGALPRLAEAGQLMVYHHESFWQPMDTLREKNILSDFAKSSNPPWLNGLPSSRLE